MEAQNEDLKIMVYPERSEGSRVVLHIELKEILDITGVRSLMMTLSHKLDSMVKLEEALKK